MELYRQTALESFGGYVVVKSQAFQRSSFATFMPFDGNLCVVRDALKNSLTQSASTQSVLDGFKACLSDILSSGSRRMKIVSLLVRPHHFSMVSASRSAGVLFWTVTKGLYPRQATQADRLNATLRNELVWTFGGKQQRGWYLRWRLSTVNQRERRRGRDTASAGFSAQVASWQAKAGLGSGTACSMSSDAFRNDQGWQSDDSRTATPTNPTAFNCAAVGLLRSCSPG